LENEVNFEDLIKSGLNYDPKEKPKKAKKKKQSKK
jgi:hypothetical protein